MTLTASSITGTGATLTISNHTAAWYWQRHSVAPGPCTAVAASTATATLTDLTAATAYTYKAYSDSTCATELTNDSRDADFTTPGIVLSTFHTVVTEGSSATYTVKLATAPTSDVTVTVSRATDRNPGVTVDTDSNTTGDQSTLTFTSQTWDTAQTVTVSVAANSDDYGYYWGSQLSLLHDAASSDAKYSGASAANAVTVIDSGTSVLSASSVTAAGATLSISNRTTAWYYRGLSHLGGWGTCTEVAAGTASVTLTGLSPGTDHTYKAYSDSTCTSEITDAFTRASFATPGVKLSTLKLIAPEGSTATYTARLATKPAGTVTVTVTKGAGGDADLTVDTDPNSSGNQDTLTFTAANWDVPQTVTVTAAEETGSTDKAYGTAAFSHAAAGSGYATAASTLTVSEGDNDVCQGTTAVASAASGGLVDDCNTLLAAKATLAGTSTEIDNWATTLAIASWTGINTANNRVSGVDAPRKSLDGSIPNTLGNLTNLTSLSLWGNALSGQIPTQLGNLTNLTQLWLGDNALSGQIPTQLGNLTKLTSLNLDDNSLSGQIPAQLGNLTNLTVLYLYNNALSGQIPTQLGNLTNLTRLWLDRNALSGQIPAELGNLTNLTRLRLGDNALSGRIPTQLGNLTKLISLDLDDNSLSGRIPTQLGNLTNLEFLDLDDNSLSGRIPTQLGNLTKLISLDLEHNALSGQIPTQLGNLTKLTYLYLYDNALSGRIPTQLGNLTNLISLDLSDNSLSGQIPAQLGNLTNLTILYLHDNALSGQIPTQLGNLTNLSWLHLRNNALSGCLPSNWHKYAISTSFGYALNPQQADRTLGVCDGIVLSDARPSVGEGSTADYTVRLSSAPSSTVTVTVSAAGDSDITVDTNTTTAGDQDTLTFTNQTWAIAQTVRLSAAQDANAVHGTATVTHTTASSDSAYSGIAATAIAVEADNETGLNAVSVSATGASLEMSNRSGSWYYQQSSPTQGTCATKPTSATGAADVTGLSPNTAYTFKAYSDSTCSTEITTAATDAEFTTASGVLLSRTHLDAAEGSTATYTVELATAPTGGVTVALTKATDDDADLTFNPSSLSFTTGNWDTAQTVTVTAASDTDTADGSAVLMHTPSSSDTKYNSSAASITVTERDDDAVLGMYAMSANSATLLLENHTGAWYFKQTVPTVGACLGPLDTNAGAVTAPLLNLSPNTSYTFKAYSNDDCSTEITAAATDAEFTTPTGGIVLSPTSVTVAEGSSATYTVKLGKLPDAAVTVNIHRTTTSDTDLTHSPATLTFTTGNWDTAQTVTVSAASDSDSIDGTAAFVHVASSTDGDYNNAAVTATATETDNAVRLTASGVTSTGATLTITNHTTAWRYKQTAPTAGTCSAEIAAGTSQATLSSLAPGTDYTYRAYSNSTCTSEITDAFTRARFATPGVMLSTLKLIAPEGSTATYTARLATKPAGSVTVTVAAASGGDSDLTFDTDSDTNGNQATLTFTTTNWSTPQAVTVTAAEESDGTDKAYGTATLTHTAAGYATAAASLTVSEGDNDVCPGTTAVGGASVTTGGLVDDCNTLLAAKATLAGTSTAIDNWATTLAIASWTGITTADSRVSQVDASGNSLDGSIPNTLGNLTNLTRLLLHDNALSGQIPAQLGNLTNLTRLLLHDNALSGQIPTQLGNLTNLTRLDLDDNALSGQIPTQLGNLTNLSWLYLNDNALSGQIPAQLGSLTNLTHLWLYNNALSGQIPAQLGNLTNLTNLLLSGNALSGQIPAQLGNLTNLTHLYLYDNALSGQIPAQLGNLTNLNRPGFGGGSVP